MKRITTTTLLAGLLLGGGSQGVNAQSPKIVVGIVVDQLRGDYLQQLRPYFGSRGFNRLMSDGLYIQDVDFHRSVGDAPSGAAVVYTGAWPVVNGVAAAESLDVAQRRNVPTLGVAARSKTDYSPEGLKLSTIADELYINGGNLTRIYSVAADPQVAVITAGHAGAGAIWFDESTGRWSSPGYYGSMPPAVGNKNHTSSVSSRIGSMSWRPLHGSSFYDFGSSWNPADFSYSFSSGRDGYTRLKGAAPFNTEVTDVALDLLKSMQSGVSSSQPGMLSVGYNLAAPDFDFDDDSRPELVDAYMRLDNDLGRLLDAIDRDYGAGNAVVFLTSTGYAREPKLPENDARIPTGEITLMKAESLLNAYLSAAYGNGDYVNIIKDGRLYLNSKEVERKGLDLKAIRSDAKLFLLKMGGVAEAFSIDEVMAAQGGRLAELALGVDLKNTPDIFLTFTPGWTVTDDNVYPTVSEKVRLSAPPTPAFIMAPGVVPRTLEGSVEATAIAPTVTSLLRIRAPNGAASKPIL